MSEHALILDCDGVLADTEKDGHLPAFNAAFAEACEAAGIAFVGPTPEQLRVFGLKHTARALAKQHGVPMLEGTELLENLDAALKAGEEVGYPVMLKSTAGGGGIGMRVCRSAEELSDAFEAVKRLGQNNFSDSGVFIEKYIQHARHLEVQVFGDGVAEQLLGHNPSQSHQIKPAVFFLPVAHEALPQGDNALVPTISGHVDANDL